jgi:hypothetical protein
MTTEAPALAMAFAMAAPIPFELPVMRATLPVSLLIYFILCWVGCGRALFAPGRVEDDAAKVGSLERGVVQGKHVRVHGAGGGFRLVAETIVKGMNDLFFEVISARMRRDDFLALTVRYIEVSDAKDVHLNACGYQGHLRLLMLGNTRRGVERDGVPHDVDGGLVNAVSAQEILCGVSAIPKLTYRRYDAHGTQIGEAVLDIAMRVWFPDELINMVEAHGLSSRNASAATKRSDGLKDESLSWSLGMQTWLGRDNGLGRRMPGFHCA